MAMKAGARMPTTTPPVPGPQGKSQGQITASDRWAAFLNHLLSWEGLSSIATICGIIAAELAGAHLSAQWIATAITVLTLVNVIGARVASAFGNGQLQTVLRARGKLA